MTAQHTPGPWRVEVWNYHVLYEHVPTIVAAQDIVAEATSLCGMDSDREDERAANARLIAAAPEMLEALIITAKSHGFATLNPVAQRRVNEAIDKATRED